MKTHFLYRLPRRCAQHLLYYFKLAATLLRSRQEASGMKIWKVGIHDWQSNMLDRRNAVVRQRQIQGRQRQATQQKQRKESEKASKEVSGRASETAPVSVASSSIPASTRAIAPQEPMMSTPSQRARQHYNAALTAMSMLVGIMPMTICVAAWLAPIRSLHASLACLGAGAWLSTYLVRTIFISLLVGPPDTQGPDALPSPTYTEKHNQLRLVILDAAIEEIGRTLTIRYLLGNATTVDPVFFVGAGWSVALVVAQRLQRHSHR